MGNAVLHCWSNTAVNKAAEQLREQPSDIVLMKVATLIKAARQKIILCFTHSQVEFPPKIIPSLN
jgi:hypothetical protein